MKTYPFILISRGDMTKLQHFATAEKLALSIYPKNGRQIAEGFIIIKNENTVVKLDELKHFTALELDTFKKLQSILEKA